MIATCKAELFKLLTVSSTYITIIIALALVALSAGFGNGYRASLQNLHNPGILANESANAIIFTGIILAIVGLLLVANEYRYNTVLYMLTRSNNRAESLLAKVLAVTIFAVTVSALMTLFTPLCTIIGAHIAGKHLVSQAYPVGRVIWQCVFVGWGYAMYAFILAAIIRSQVGSLVTFLLIPLIGEHIVMAIFKNSGSYLPFNNLQSVVNSLLLKGDASPIGTVHAVIVACIYIFVGLLASFILFARRDAT